MKSSLQQWTIIILGLASIAGLIAAAPGRTKPLSKNIDKGISLLLIAGSEQQLSPKAL